MTGGNCRQLACLSGWHLTGSYSGEVLRSGSCKACGPLLRYRRRGLLVAPNYVGSILKVGKSVGAFEGQNVGLDVVCNGAGLGRSVGASDGTGVGLKVGLSVTGAAVGASDGAEVGETVGFSVLGASFGK